MPYNWKIRKAKQIKNYQTNGLNPFSCPKRLKALARLFVDFKVVWYAFLLIVGLSFTVTLLEIPYPFIIGLLRTSRTTSWGIVTGIFAHESFIGHYLPNVVTLLFVCLFFAFTNANQEKEVKERRTRFFVIMMFVGAISANILFIILAPLASSIGSSGIDYAALGVTLGFAIHNAIHAIPRKLREFTAFYKNKGNFYTIASNLLVSLFFLTILIKYPDLFLASGGNVNKFVHAVAFIVAFVATFVYTWEEMTYQPIRV
jgi:hypothetical protein